MQISPAKDPALDRMAQVVTCNRRRVRPLWAIFFVRVAVMCASPAPQVRTAATATLKRTVLAILATRDTEAGPCADADDAMHSGGPTSAVASGAHPALLPPPGAPLLL